MAKYYVKNDGSTASVVNTNTGEIVYTGTPDAAASQAEELNRQSGAEYNQATTVTPKAIANTKVDPKANDENPTPAPDKTAAKSTAPNAALGKRTWNPLGDFSSYTYRVSLYALPPEALNFYNDTGTWEKSLLYLICQSGGISNDPATDAQRAPGFELDFFIDDVEIITIINSKDLKQSSNTNEIKIRIMEPFGATFPQRLVEAQQAINANSSLPRNVVSTTEALWGHYLIVIRFYGYDVNGQLINPDKYNTSGQMSKQLDEVAVFERAFPVYIREFDFRLEGKGQTYNLGTVSINTGVGLGSQRTTVDTELNAQGKTVGEAIGGEGKTVEGLLDELNKRSKAGKGQTCEIPDEFEVVFEQNSKIKPASLLDKNLNKDRTPMHKVTGTGGSNVRQSAASSSANIVQQRTIKIAGGTPIVQAIDQIVSQSSYVSDALTVIDSEDPQPAQEGQSSTTDNSKPDTLQWYIILPTTKVLGFDKIRNDYAYKITYVVKSYDIPYVRSTAINYVPKYPGPHKIYNYWYTGKNSEVISYEQVNNIGYFLYLGNQAKNASKDNTSSGVRMQAKPVNNADATGKAAGSFEGPNSVKSFLYSPDDLQQARITILGDPDFLMPVTSGTIGEMMTKWYGPNFTINPNSGQVFIEVVFNQVEDYSLNTGTLTPGELLNMNNFQNTPHPGAESVAKGTVFMVQTVHSTFHKGRFSQTFEVVLPPFGEMDKMDNPGSGTSNSSNGGGREKTTGTSPLVVNSNKTSETSKRLNLPLSSTAGGGRGGQGGPTAEQANQNPKLPPFKKAVDISTKAPVANDDELFIATGGLKSQGGRGN